MKICIVEDNQLYANLMKRYLSNIMQGSTIDVHSSASQFLASDEKYNLVFMDIQLNHHAPSGIDLIRLKQEEGDSTNFILLSSSKRDKYQALADELGIQFIEKDEFAKLDSSYNIKQLIELSVH